MAILVLATSSFVEQQRAALASLAPGEHIHTALPHIAATPRPEVAAAQFLDNLHRARVGAPLVNRVDRERGY